MTCSTTVVHGSLIASHGLTDIWVARRIIQKGLRIYVVLGAADSVHPGYRIVLLAPEPLWVWQRLRWCQLLSAQNRFFDAKVNAVLGHPARRGAFRIRHRRKTEKMSSKPQKPAPSKPPKPAPPPATIGPHQRTILVLSSRFISHRESLASDSPFHSTRLIVDIWVIFLNISMGIAISSWMHFWNMKRYAKFSIIQDTKSEPWPNLRTDKEILIFFRRYLNSSFHRSILDLFVPFFHSETSRARDSILWTLCSFL